MIVPSCYQISTAVQAYCVGLGERAQPARVAESLRDNPRIPDDGSDLRLQSESERVFDRQPVVVGTCGEIFRDNPGASRLSCGFDHRRIPVG